MCLCLAGWLQPTQLHPAAAAPSTICLGSAISLPSDFHNKFCLGIYTLDIAVAFPTVNYCPKGKASVLAPDNAGIEI